MTYMQIRSVPIALIGFGNAARRLAEILIERGDDLAAQYQLRFFCTAIATARYGAVVAPAGIDLGRALELVRNNRPLSALADARAVADSLAAIDESAAEIVVETTTLNIHGGEPARTHIARALIGGKHAVTANKGPLAFAARELRALAAAHKVCLRYESTVMDGAPVFNLAARTLPLVTVQKVRGIINSTTNFILTAMEAGRSYQDALAEAQARGIAEADASLDTEGWDAAVKATVLANCLMGADLKPGEVARTGISHLKADELAAARARGAKIRLLTTVERTGQEVRAQVAPAEIAAHDLLYAIDGFSNALELTTDLMGTIAMVEENPQLTQTAYGLLSDLISIATTLE